MLSTTTSLPCSGVNDLCGTILASENNAALKNIVVELRDVNGVVKKSAPTAVGTGQYSFTSLTAGQRYYVVPAVDRTQAATPNQLGPILIPTLQNYDFKVRNVAATLHFSNEKPGTFLLVTPSTYTLPNPPTVTVAGAPTYSSTVGMDGKSTIKVPFGSYYLTCWVPLTCANKITYVRAPAANSSTIGNNIAPQATIANPPACNAICP